MRKLIYLPMVHSQSDMGSMSNSLLLEGEKKYGKDKWEKHIETVNNAWSTIKNKIDIETLNSEIKIYQDGLPIAGEVGLKIINDCANNGSENYKIIQQLIKDGAKLELAESRELLMYEYSYISTITKAETSEQKLIAYRIYNDIAQELLEERDKFISNQINTTLKDGEIGIAFFGAIHSIIDKIDKDIEIIIIDVFTDEISLNIRNRK